MEKTLIIGAGSRSKKDPAIKGIGTCLVERLAREGRSQILFTYHNSENGAKELIQRACSENPFCKIDSMRFDSLDYRNEWPALEARVSEVGTPDIFIYNAGLRFYKEKLSEQEKEETMTVNYHCPAFLIEKIGKKMAEEHERGRIIVTSSVIAGKHHPFLEDYCNSKGLLNKYVWQHKEKWRERGIEILIVSPGLTVTPMIEERLDFYRDSAKQRRRQRISSAEEIAESIAQLCLP
jgi:NAD(P)-dependent dehydrogenase (short-subunit alcohol dehydrogenase family)